MGEESPLKVFDRRRFAPDGTPREPPSASPPPPPPEANQAPAPTSGAELQRAHRRIDELTRAYTALERDREDYKKRLQREREQLLEAERGEVALALLEVVDGLDLALTNADRPAFVEGVRVVREDVLRRAQRLGIERIHLLGTVFDPGLAEAVDVVADADPAHDNTVVSEVQAAYRMKGRLVRAGRVCVARFTGPASL